MSESVHCRACFDVIDPKTSKTSKLSDKLKNCHEVSLAYVLSECTGLCLDPNDNDIVCSSCKQSLTSFYKFRQKVLDADRKFKELNVKVEVKLEEDFKMEVDVWQSDPGNQISDSEEVTEKKPKRTRGKRGKGKAPKLHDTSNKRRRYRDPQRKENLEKFKRNLEGLFECPRDNCPGLFKNMGHLEMHLENKHPNTDQTTFPCAQCDEIFLTFNLHRRHIFKAHTPRPYICDICGNTYPHIEGLRSHIIVVHISRKKEKSKCACTICGKVYVCEANMLRHRKEVHFPKELVPKPYVCNVCGTAWATKSKLFAHMKSHDSPEFFCDICSKGYSLKGALQLHMQTHTTERPFFCDICGKTYKTKYQLRDHQLGHNEERTLKCSMCPATFKLTNSLRSHESQVHASTGPVSCEVCGKLCKNKSSLKSHSVLHSTKELQCPHCDKNYKVMDTLKRHIQRTHLGLKKRHECSVCLKNLWSRKHIADHIQEAHQDVMAGSGKTADELVRKYWTSDPSGVNLGETPPKGILGRPMTS